jgi:protein-S-isoprenylcysteine O-methyltransferase Ste14
MPLYSHRHQILLHHLQMYIGWAFLLGIGIAVVVALFGVFKNSRSLKDNIVISHSAQDDDARL